MQQNCFVNGYTIDRCIGTGQYGSVYKVNMYGQTFAMKIMKQLQKQSEIVSKHEMSRLLELRHPFIIRYMDEFRVIESEVYIIMEFCTGINMNNAINNTREQCGNFSEHTVTTWLVQLLMAVAYLHQKGIIHREIKPNNIFILDNNARVKLGDLSLFRELSPNDSMALSSARRERESYRAPELWQGLTIRSNVDEWSLGCVLYELMCLRPPFSIVSLENLINARYEPIPPGPFCESNLIEIMVSLLTPNPINRPHASQVLDYPVLSAPRHEMYEMYEDLLSNEPLPSVCEEYDDEFDAVERDVTFQYPGLRWAITVADSFVQHTWRDMVTGFGGKLAFRPYRLPAPYSNVEVQLWLVRREGNHPGEYKKDMRIWVQTNQQPPDRRLLLRFHITLQFFLVDMETSVLDLDCETIAKEKIEILYSEPSFNWHEFDPERPPSASVSICLPYAGLLNDHVLAQNK